MNRILLALACLPLCLFAKNERPNIVVFLADDAGWGDYLHYKLK